MFFLPLYEVCRSPQKGAGGQTPRPPIPLPHWISPCTILKAILLLFPLNANSKRGDGGGGEGAICQSLAKTSPQYKYCRSLSRSKVHQHSLHLWLYECTMTLSRSHYRY